MLLLRVVRAPFQEDKKMFRGSLPALVTPFRDGQVDEKSLKHLVEWHIEEGSHGLVPVGTTGESPTLSHEEHETVVETVVQAAAGRVPVIAGCGSNDTQTALMHLQFCQEAGADAAASHDASGGNDTLVGNVLNDTLSGGNGSDLVQGGDGDDALFGAFERATRPDDEASDTLVGGAGDDALFMGDGDTGEGR